MSDLIYNFRYPFKSAIDFFSGLYFLKLEALHLTIGYLLLLYFVIKVFFDKNIKLPCKFSLIYFSATIFNNNAYSVGITIAELFGIIAVIVYLPGLKISKNLISSYMIVFSFLALIHLLILSIFYDAVLDSISIMRFAVIFKIVVLALNISILFRYIQSKALLDTFIKHVISFTNVVAICYFIQILVFASGTLPYGSFSPAGWSESIIPSFGSTSIERGHLGKFFVPLFPLYLYAFISLKYKKSFVLFLLTCLLNMSASAYIFLLFYLLLTFALFRVELKSVIFVMVFLISTIAFIFYNQIIVLFMKVYTLAISSDESGGGRSFSIIFDIWDNFPFGYGYGGSTFRDLHGILGLNLNNAIVVFFGQLSVLAPFLLSVLIYLFYKLYRDSLLLNNGFVKKLLFISLFVMVIIFSADSLWFVPTIWLPVVVFTILVKIYKRGFNIYYIR